jgi:hypothetical protein
MQRPIMAVAVVAALVAATGGTAVAAGELITRGDQVAANVIDGRHIASQGVARTDQQHAALRLRVRLDGGLFGDPRDGTVTRFEPGHYRITFDRTVITDDVAGPRSPRWLDDCAVVATPRTGGLDGRNVTLTTSRGTTPGAVNVFATRPDYELKRSVPIDAPFDIAAVC